MARLDSYGVMPSGLSDYLQLYGWHFSKKLCEWAISKMKKKNPQTGKEEPVEMKNKEQVEEFLKRHGVSINNAEGYDCVYVFHMASADYWRSSLTDEAHLALFIKDYFNDIDSYNEKALTQLYADCIAMGRPILWTEML